MAYVKGRKLIGQMHVGGSSEDREEQEKSKTAREGQENLLTLP